MKQQNIEKELYPILENEILRQDHLKLVEILIHWILLRKILNFGKAMTGTSYPKNRLNERIITAPERKI